MGRIGRIGSAEALVAVPAVCSDAILRAGMCDEPHAFTHWNLKVIDVHQHQL